jgi:hypothetical protein
MLSTASSNPGPVAKSGSFREPSNTLGDKVPESLTLFEAAEEVFVKYE